MADLFGQPLLLFVAIVAASLLLAKGVLFVLTHYVKSLAKHTKTTLDDRLLDGLSLPIYLSLLAAGLWTAYYASFGPSDFLGPAGSLGFLVVAAFFLMRLSDSLLSWYREDVLASRASGADVTELIGRVFKGVLLVVFLIMALGTLGVEVTPLIASLGIAGLAVALAFQDTLSNFFAGVYLTADRPVRVGDFVKLESGDEGYVAKIGWRTTLLYTLSNNLIVLPNSKLAQAVITNYSQPQKELSIVIPLRVAYGSDLDCVERVIVEEATRLQREVPGAVADFKPFVRYNAFGEHGVQFSVILRVQSFVDQYLMTHEFVKALAVRLEQEQIAIPLQKGSVQLSTPAAKKPVVKKKRVAVPRPVPS